MVPISHLHLIAQVLYFSIGFESNELVEMPEKKMKTENGKLLQNVLSHRLLAISALYYDGCQADFMTFIDASLRPVLHIKFSAYNCVVRVFSYDN